MDEAEPALTLMATRRHLHDCPGVAADQALQKCQEGVALNLEVSYILHFAIDIRVRGFKAQAVNEVDKTMYEARYACQVKCTN